YMFRLLDIGADGILVPGVHSQEDVTAILSASRFPPIGDRGVAPSTRAADFGGHARASIKELTDRLNEQQVVGVLIENQAALQHIDAIVGMEGLSFVFIGPVDLSSSLGLLGEKGGHPILRDAIDRIIESCARAGVPFGTIANDPAASLTTADLRERSARLVVVGIDTTLLRGRLAEIMSSIRAGDM
ncbi:MAG TPA: aldolase/citrate lyase family protein, partial [Acidimicrobiales bacterium]|nr:aldolase/citrate lyase family protein [Acidimicrobiales bacterium]